MLTPDQVSAGTLGDAKGITLMLPRQKYEQRILIFPEGQGHRAVLLEDELFRTFDCTGNEHYQGMLVPNVRFEVDETTAFDARSFYTPGALVRVGTELKIYATPEQRHTGSRATRFTMLDGLAPCGNQENVGFGHWQIVIGGDLNKKVLHKVEIIIPSDR